MTIHSRTPQPRSKSPVWSGYAVFIWSMAYMILHVDWALGGKWGEAVLKPGILQIPQIELINWVASAMLTAAGLVGLAFIYWIKGRVAKYLLLFIAWAGCSVAASHGIYAIVYRILQISGIVRVESRSFDLHEHAYVLWDLVIFEPWFLIEGILFCIVGWCYLHEKRSRNIWLTACIIGIGFGLVTGMMGVRFA